MALTSFLIFLWVCVACIADVFFKNATGFGDVKFFYGLALYAMTGIFALLAFKRIEFGPTMILWVAMSLLVSLLVSVFYYHEKFTANMGVSVVLILIVAGLIGGK